MGQRWLRIGFNRFGLAMLALDRFVFPREAHEVRLIGRRTNTNQ